MVGCRGDVTSFLFFVCFSKLWEALQHGYIIVNVLVDRLSYKFRTEWLVIIRTTEPESLPIYIIE